MRIRTALLAGIAAVVTAVIASQAQVPGTNSTLNSVFNLVYEASTSKPTYSATTGAVTSASAATDICTLSGSATKTIRVRRVIVGGLSSTVQTDPVSILKRSTNTTGGVSALLTTIPYDSNSAAASAVAESYTTNGTQGTLVGVLVDRLISIGNLTTGAASPPATEFVFGQLGSPVFLRGLAQQIAVNLGGLTYVSGSFSCTFEWTEDNDS